ncbi:hypothetical protein BU52_33155, partial [Streptomyces toyocaensis]
MLSRPTRAGSTGLKRAFITSLHRGLLFPVVHITNATNTASRTPTVLARLSVTAPAGELMPAAGMTSRRPTALPQEIHA